MGTDKDKEQAFFLQQMQGVERLQDNSRIAPWRVRLKPFPLDHTANERAVNLAEEERDLYSDHEIEAGDELEYAVSGIQKRVLQDLRRGKIQVQGELDLHGLTSKDARDALNDFIQQCQRRSIRCARIIHGKGLGSTDRQPVLKQKVNIWLRQFEEVLAFCSATSRDGGTGAVYVLLRSPDKGKRHGRER